MLASSSTAVKYPLTALNITSATRSYQQGFWQQTPPVPLSRWKTISNTTCIKENNSNHGHNTNDRSQSRDNTEFHHRVPFVMVLGAQKAGTTALVKYLSTHPHIQHLPIKELRYFDEYLDGNPDNILLQDNGGGGIPADKVLQVYQEQVIGGIIPLEVLQLSSYLKIVDGTPNYLMMSDRVPQRVLCAAPWVKLLVLLRDPVDRAFSQYNMQYHRDVHNPTNRRGFSTFEEYIDMDIQVLNDVGVLNNATVLDEEYLSSQQLMASWSTYTKLGLNSPVGRGLYAIQLYHWLQQMKAYGKDSNTDLLVLQSERMNNDTKETFDEVLQFLELPNHTLPQFGKIHTTTYRTKRMEQSTRSRLEDIFRPFNRHLERLLGDDWRGVWDG
ncbi:sulfotransferase [Nitzschia inconspicua]|uniref:Sulfotransferase n=1 Tax=Nitzschia inconspicua TaxID=303405 RepID=A0A9K3KPT7_9STRA|nr:sulfotransferase [Nitzschia inconspicua]